MNDTRYFTRYHPARLVFSNRDVFAYHTNTFLYYAGDTRMPPRAPSGSEPCGGNKGAVRRHQKNIMSTGSSSSLSRLLSELDFCPRPIPHLGACSQAGHNKVPALLTRLSSINGLYPIFHQTVFLSRENLPVFVRSAVRYSQKQFAKTLLTSHPSWALNSGHVRRSHHSMTSIVRLYSNHTPL